MRVLLITEYFQPIESGAEKVARLFYRDMTVRLSNEVDIITSSEVKNESVKFPILYTHNGKFIFQELFRFFNYFKIRNIIKLGNYDIVTVHGFNSLMFYAVKASFLEGVPSVMVMCTSDILDVKKHEKITFSFLKRSIKYVDVFIAKGMSPTIMKNTLKIPASKFQFSVNPAISDSINTLEISDRLIERLRLSSSFKIVTSGKLSRTKNPEVLIEAVHLLKDYDIELYFFGEGPLKKLLMKRVESLKMGEKIFFTGRIDSPFKYYKNFDLYVFPTNLEPALSQAMMEAMNCGLPVIVRESEGINHWFKHLDNVFLIREISVTELKDAIRYLIEHSEIRRNIGLNAERVIQEKHNINTFTDNMVMIFDGLIKSTSPKTLLKRHSQ